MDSKGESQKRCCCFKKMRSFIICMIMTVLILVAIALLTYFLWPRMPNLYFAMPDDAINGLNLSSGSDTTALIRALASASAASPFILSLNISYSLTVFSPNYFDIEVKSIKTELQLIDASGSVVGDGGASTLTGTSDIGFQNFAKLANTTISPTLIINYSRQIPVPVGLSDPVLSHLYSVCVNPSSQSRKLTFRYNTVIDVKLISFSGYKPSATGKTSVNCPDLSSLSAPWRILNGQTGL